MEKRLKSMAVKWRKIKYVHNALQKIKYVDRASPRKRISIMDTPWTGMIDKDFVPFSIFSANFSEVGGRIH